jgi:multiple antibiotic resistance protein
VTFFIAGLVTIISVVDPVGVAALFLALTPELPAAERLRVMRRSVTVAAIILLVFAAVGRKLLDTLGITVPAFSIGGGILLFLVAIDMLFARPSRTRETPEEGAEALLSPDISVFPLAIPILSGPGAIATVVLYMSQAGTDVLKIGSVIAAIAISLIASYLAMRLSPLVLRLLGETGVHVVGRVLGILLAALAVQFVLNGIGTYYHQHLLV